MRRILVAVCGVLAVLHPLNGRAAARSEASSQVSENAGPKWGSLSDCRWDESLSLDCAVSHLGGRTAESYRDNGSELVRFGQWNAWGHFQALIEYIRTGDGQSWLNIRDVSGEGRGIVLPLSNDEWQKALAAWRAYEGSQPPAPKPPDKSGIEEVCVVTDSPSQSFEVVLDGKVFRAKSGDKVAENNYCYEPDGDLADALLREAVDAVPYCAAFKDDYALEEMEKCLVVDGDKYQAAELEALTKAFFEHGCQTSGADIADQFVSNEAGADGVDISARGRLAVSSVWLHFGCGGERDRYSEVTSVLVQNTVATVTGWTDSWAPTKEGPVHDIANFLQKWKRESDGKWRLVHVSLGKFRREKDE
jgi:hypothetical protein